MKRCLSFALSAGLFLGTVVLAPASEADVSTSFYRSCNQMTQDFPTGAASSKEAAQEAEDQGWIRPPVNRYAYDAAQALDVDGLGFVCVQLRPDVEANCPPPSPEWFPADYCRRSSGWVYLDPKLRKQFEEVGNAEFEEKDGVRFPYYAPGQGPSACQVYWIYKPFPMLPDYEVVSGDPTAKGSGWYTKKVYSDAPDEPYGRYGDFVVLRKLEVIENGSDVAQVKDALRAEISETWPDAGWVATDSMSFESALGLWPHSPALAGIPKKKRSKYSVVRANVYTQHKIDYGICLPDWSYVPPGYTREELRAESQEMQHLFNDWKAGLYG